MRICVLVSGKKYGIFSRRIHKLCQHTPSFKNALIFYRGNTNKAFNMLYFLANILKIRPDIVYIEGVAFSSCAAVMILKPFLRFKYIISTGDDYYHIIRQLYGPFLGVLAGRLEAAAYRIADAIITLGAYHKDYLISKKYKNVHYIPHGVDCKSFRPFPVGELKQKLGLEGFLTIGVVGSITWLKRYNYSYGWDIVEVIRILKDKPVKGLVVGEGNGLPYIKQLAEIYGILDKINKEKSKPSK